MLENENRFLECLRFQINQKYKTDHLVESLPLFHTKLEEKNEKILKMMDYFENVKRREIYELLIHEFHNLMEK